MTPPNAGRATAGTKNKASIYGVIGATGTGKSSYIKGDLLRTYTRLLIWSPLEETDDYESFCGGVVTTKMSDFVREVKAGTKAIIFVASSRVDVKKEQFDWFCRAAWLTPGAHVLVEELSEVTLPSWAPDAWKRLSTAGRHKGLTVIGVAQRPANMDKNFLGNCTEIRCYGLNWEPDAKVMASVMRLPTAYETDPKTKKPVARKPHEQLLMLPPLQFFHRNPDKSVRYGVNKPL